MIYSFDGQLAMSQGTCKDKTLEEIILKVFPNAIKVEPASTSDDRNGIDYWVTMLSGHRQSVDLKARGKDCIQFKTDDVALEMWSVVGKKIGWTRDSNKRTDYVLFLWKNTGRWMLVSFPMLHNVFTNHYEAWTNKYKKDTQTSNNRNGTKWQSQCVYVPRQVILDSINATFGGIPFQPNNVVDISVSTTKGTKCPKQEPAAINNAKPLLKAQQLSFSLEGWNYA